MSMMKRVIWIILALLVGAYFVNSYLSNKAKKAAEKAEAEQIRNATKAVVAELVKRTNADENWEKELSKGERFRLEPILTVELERLWLTGRPILFVGAIKDIATIDQENYRIEVERSLFSSFRCMLGTELRLTLQCPKKSIDSFLKEHPDLFKDCGWKNGVAVIADINEIETTIIAGSEGEREEIKIGKGKCIDILYTGLWW
jgi:hypothetical protein